MSVPASRDAIQKLPISPGPQTLSTLEELAHKQMLSPEHAQLLVDFSKAAQATPTQPASTEEISGDRKASRARVSKPEFKSVNEMYVPCEAQVHNK